MALLEILNKVARSQISLTLLLSKSGSGVDSISLRGFAKFFQCFPNSSPQICKKKRFVFKMLQYRSSQWLSTWSSLRALSNFLITSGSSEFPDSSASTSSSSDSMLRLRHQLTQNKPGGLCIKHKLTWPWLWPAPRLWPRIVVPPPTRPWCEKFGCPHSKSQKYKGLPCKSRHRAKKYFHGTCAPFPLGFCKQKNLHGHLL